MDAKNFLKVELNWSRTSAGHFDRNSLAKLLERFALQKNKELQHFHDTTIGLWATDRPDLIKDPQGLMFQIDKK